MIHFSQKASYKKSAEVILINQDQMAKKKFLHIKQPAYSDILLSLTQNGQFEAKAGEIFPVAKDKQIILFVGMGKKADLSLTQVRIIIRKVLLFTHIKKIKNIEVIPCDISEFAICALIEGILIGGYRWDKYINNDAKPQNSVRNTEKNFNIIAPRQKVFDETITVCQGVTLSRDLVNDNADFVTADYFEKVVKKIVKGQKNVTLEILDKKKLKTKGLNLHLAVNQGSQKEPKLIIVKYHGAPEKGGYVALVGKGLTFDAGGLNLKPTGGIEGMRQDMGGAAAVIGALKNTIDLRLKKNVIFVMGMAENAIDGNSYKPGDVIKSYSGKTVEIGNTDAEGRLVLADAISYVSMNYKPDAIIDICTLTGACVVALGNDYTGLVGNDDALIKKILKLAKDTDDRAWNLPGYPELKDSVKSKIADIRNLGWPKGAGGAITAAEFLRQFTNDTKWAHLDIAGTAFVSGDERLYFGHGATGAGVRLLTALIKTI
ncbi:MAG: leucyl aminopeptidase [Candidatus Omnitrophica bacterium]|nr:leucyl aminopeptidase [Candidatus Omnitrophota bacterium]